MTTKEFLRQYISANRSIDQKLEEISKLRNLSEKCTTVLSENKASVGFDNDKIATIVSRIVDLERQVDEEIDGLQEIRDAVMKAIHSVQDQQLRSILEFRYIGDMSWEQIAVQCGYVYRHVTRLHGIALQQVRCPIMS